MKREPTVPPQPWAQLPDGLRAASDRAVELRALSTTVPVQVWGHRPLIAQRQVELLAAFYEDSVLDDRLRELVRLRVATWNDCVACNAARKSDEVTDEDVACLSSDDSRFTAREQAALRFADQLVIDHLAIDATFMAAIASTFTSEELVELGMFIVAMLGNGRLVRAFQAYEDPDRLSERSPSGAVAGDDGMP